MNDEEFIEILRRLVNERMDFVNPGCLVCSATITALSRLIRSRESSVDADLYLTHASSLECAKNILLAGINTVFYKHKYRTSKGIDLLMNKSVLVKQIPDGE